jgi:two-component system, chemotaxis family, chemotaxis protein CheY
MAVDITILVFSSDRDLLDTLRRGLLTSGFRKLILESDSASATSYIESDESFDLAIISLTTDQTEGLDLLNTIRRIKPHVECIIVTAANDADLAVDCLKRGATDFLTLPIVKEKLINAIKQAMRYKMPADGRPRILIMEDDPVSGLLMLRYLDSCGECNLVTDGKKAIESFEQAIETDNRYHLIILDIMVPEIHGKDVLKEIRELEMGKGIPEQGRAKIIMTTALSDSVNIIDSFTYKCDAYLIKPIDKKTLLGEIMRLGVVHKLSEK